MTAPAPTVTAAALAASGHDLQLVFEHPTTGQVNYWMVRSGAILVLDTYGSVTTNYTLIGAGDVSNDGITDLVWDNESAAGLTAWRLGSSDQFAGNPELPNAPRPWRLQAVGDLNGDGNGDLVWRNTSTGEVRVWLMNGATVSSAATVEIVTAPGWRIATAGDLTGDGRADLLWENTSTGARLVWVMNGATHTSSVDLGAVPTNWTIAAVGDWDDNGQNDILWQDPAVGTLVVWLMNGTTYLQSVNPPSPPAPWRLAAVRRSAVFSTPNSCQASVSATNVTYNDELAQYGVGEDTETVQFCETWVGNDYVTRAVQQTSTAYEAFENDAVRTYGYASGQITGYDASGNALATEAAGATEFDAFNITAAERQASYDDPYYGLTAPLCADPLQLRCDDNPPAVKAPTERLPTNVNRARVASPMAVSDPTGRMGRKLRHGLRRLGVRVLVDDLDEVGRGPKGERRFKGRRDGGEVTVDIDPATELLVAEETVTPAGTFTSKHTWAKANGRYFVQRLETEFRYTDARGKPSRSSTTMTASNFAWAAR